MGKRGQRVAVTASGAGNSEGEAEQKVGHAEQMINNGKRLHGQRCRAGGAPPAGQQAQVQGAGGGQCGAAPLITLQRRRPCAAQAGTSMPLPSPSSRLCHGRLQHRLDLILGGQL